MDVFIGNLSPRTTLNDLVVFFKGFAPGARFQIFDKQFEDGSRSRYAVAIVEPDKLAEKAIKKLNGAFLQGSKVVLREFLHRSYNNERRLIGWRDKPWHGIERRVSERRRKQALKSRDIDAKMGTKQACEPTEKIDPNNIRIEARDLFARKH